MSALRISRPGYPVQLIVQEPAKARVPGFNGVALGFFSGTTLTAHQRRDNQRRIDLDRKRELQREASARYRAKLAGK